MSRLILGLWLGPLALFWGWYFLSMNDVSFGTFVLSRDFHDQLLAVYAQVLGIDPGTIPEILKQALVSDGILLAGILAFRRRRQIAAAVMRRLRAHGLFVSRPATMAEAVERPL
ncbi:DUF6105 family protein [Mangrovibrevibacter kandeliae]|uniref:DUF6105 family protein n=1 Tax=Mangrovibrevibacter kandeliae TaxID=2968473 RepID=UPI002119B25F|nr:MULTISPECIES: DUF6105 family protein [unclassified Aurantimonas]MCQ8782514.1 DUF6105 family protein [Aurantimonas sp. CSK15Z-1]MCW4114677.1 DUF6105 family protein [Aurantimonas sp. MSK8Z-1]